MLAALGQITRLVGSWQPCDGDYIAKMNDESTVRIEIRDDVARIIFDKPDARANTLSTNVWTDFAAALAVVQQQANIRGAIVMSAKDGIFIAGADLKELYELTTGPAESGRALLQLGLGVLGTLESLPFPTVAMIDGAALGGGLEVALACDYRVAGSHPKCKLGLPEVKLGLIPGWGGTQRLPRIVGIETACGMLITGQSYSALEAFAIGLVDEGVPSDQLDAAAMTLLPHMDWSTRRAKKKNTITCAMAIDWSSQLSQLSEDERPAAETALRVVIEGAKLSLEAATNVETEAFIPLLQGQAARKRIEAFLKK